MGEIIAEKRPARQNGYSLAGLISARTLTEERGRPDREVQTSQRSRLPSGLSHQPSDAGARIGRAHSPIIWILCKEEMISVGGGGS